MSAVLGIVQGHKGAIFLESNLNKGTTFKILLAKAESRKQQVKQKDIASPAEMAGSLRNSPLEMMQDIIRDTCKIMLERMGFTVLLACNGEEALTVFDKHIKDIGLVILDFCMPGKDGYEIFKELRAVKPDLKVIISSGFSEQDVMRNFEGQGLSGFMAKPDPDP